MLYTSVIKRTHRSATAICYIPILHTILHTFVPMGQAETTAIHHYISKYKLYRILQHTIKKITWKKIYNCALWYDLWQKQVLSHIKNNYLYATSIICSFNALLLNAAKKCDNVFRQPYSKLESCTEIVRKSGCVEASRWRAFIFIAF